MRPLQLGPSATVLLPTTEVAVTSSVNGIFQLVALPQDQIVHVTIQFPTGEAAQVVKVEALDGGLVAAVVPSSLPGGENIAITFPEPQLPATSGTVSAQGNFTFIFRVGHPPGLYQIRMRQGNQVLGLQFWVRDPQNPANNPPAITPALAVGVSPTNPI